MRKNIEATILSALLTKEYYADDGKPFELDEEVFSTDGFKYVARQINRAIRSNTPTSLVFEKLRQALTGTAYEMDLDFIDGRSYLNMSIVKRYYDDLVITHRKTLARAAL